MKNSFKSEEQHAGVNMSFFNSNKIMEKETTRRYLLANMLSIANSSQLKASHGRWANFWQGLFKSPRTM
jgi:hypothetical protein